MGNISLNKILSEIEINLKNKEVDLETNSVSHDVEYVYKFKHNYKELDNFIHNLQKLAYKSKPTDPEMEDFIHIAKNLRNKYARYLNTKHPDWKGKFEKHV